ncbi:MAG: six-hairpin glycosidase [Bacteroidales bacterium]|nr:six-hairpin glycosidase [Bacteroidales bacterium]
MRILSAASLLLFSATSARVSADTRQAHYTGTTLSNPYRHDGGLSPVIGVQNIQTVRSGVKIPGASAEANELTSWTYNHQPMLTHWQGRLWLHYLSDPRSEHVYPSRTLLQSSEDGLHWSEPSALFPIYATEGRADEVAAVMHQRVGWYISSEATGQKLLALGHYGVCLTPKDDPNDGNGIGRVVREVKADGSLGPIYFLYYNHDYSEKNTRYPLYTKSKDKKFRKACEEILNNPLYWMQMVEECDRDDARLPIKNPYKAFCYYPLADGSLVAFWKHALTSRSFDGGQTWTFPAKRARGFVNSNAKIWGQALPDGTYATVYNPAEFRWPLAISLSTDGLEYNSLHLIHGEISPMRYGGQYKSYGPQYTRGVLPLHGIEKTDRDTCFYVTYSVNKEDIWVSRIPVPVKTVATHFEEPWNVYAPLLAPAAIEGETIVLKDSDPFDYCKVERVIPASRELTLSFDIQAAQTSHGRLELELQDEHGTPCTRVQWQADSLVMVKTGARYNAILNPYEAHRTYHIEMQVSLNDRMITFSVDTVKFKPKMLFAPLEAITRICFRTGEERTFPTINTPADNDTDLPHADALDPEASWTISHVRCYSPAKQGAPSLLRWNDYRHYVENFNAMEDENIAQAIPNADAADWMETNIPLFDCPDKQVEEMFYYRWWTLRKHIKETPVGYGMTEFLVDRSYADQYNLIACAIGHHIMESRWLHDPKYLDGIVNTWLRGNFNPKTGGDSINGGPMAKLDKFSSWMPYAMWQRVLVNGDTAWFENYRKDLESDMQRWERDRNWKDGMFWQADVKDGMEEQISGGRKVRNRRPTINSYMAGNYKVLGQTDRYESLRNLIEQKLWDDSLAFFGTLTEKDSIAQVRELIGYLPWYFRLPADDSAKYKNAWLQLLDESGFDAPAGMTTAERRHPLFRKAYKGRPTCEWDGAVWPFATSQTLTALIQVQNYYPNLSAVLPKELFWHHFKKYTESMHFHGRPYVGEYLDEKTGYWLWGEQERSRYYNHSTYNDLVITGLCGFNPEQPTVLTPLAPENWDYWCLDGLLYHGHTITILFDRYGTHYHQGKGLMMLVDGHPTDITHRL